MRDTSGEQSDGLHLLRLPEAFLRDAPSLAFLGFTETALNGRAQTGQAALGDEVVSPLSQGLHGLFLFDGARHDQER